MPLSDVESVYKQHSPDYLLTVITNHPVKNSVQDYIDQLLTKFPKSHILLTGHQVVGQDVNVNDKVTILNKFQDLMNFIDEKQDIEEEMISL